MDKNKVTQDFEVKIRGYNRLNCSISITVEGTEIPNAALVAENLDVFVNHFKENIKDFHLKVPERIGTTPIAEPYKS